MYNSTYMTKKICILGRQSALSLAELESLVGARNVTPFGRDIALVQDETHPLQQHLLGGTIKIADLISKDAHLRPEQLQEVLATIASDLAATLPEGKITLGVSVYGQKIAPRKVGQWALMLKKVLSQAGRSVRVVPNSKSDLNSAQVFHNKLTNERGVELIIAFGPKNQIAIGRTLAVQDIDSYSFRDFKRPKRDARVGMLPPKLAQILLNTAQAKAGEHVLDPFCGTGVLLMEASLMGCIVQGTDIEQRMIDYTTENLDWLEQKYKTPVHSDLTTGDARNHQWHMPLDHIVCEGFLGKPLTALPPRHILQPIMDECNTLLEAFLRNAATQLPAGARCTFAVPTWAAKKGFLPLPVVDQLSEIGYNRVSFMHVNDQDLIYHREDQVVARQLLVLTRK